MSTPVPARLPIRATAALLCLAVSWIHVQDQGGFPGDKTPHYVGIGYYLLEVAGVLCAVLLLSGAAGPGHRTTWLLGGAVALGPLVGFVLSRGPGLPDYTDDKGNWTEPLGLLSIGVEAALLALALAALLADPRAAAARVGRQPERIGRR